MKNSRKKQIIPGLIAYFIFIQALAGMAACGGENGDDEFFGEDPDTYLAGEGEIFDEEAYEPSLMGKADSPAYVIPDVPDLVRPEIIISLDGLNILLMDRATGFVRVYPTGPGRLNSNGVSITPVGHFATGPNTSDSWWYMASRYVPDYFDGLPFLRLTTLNSRGHATYGLHGPITTPLVRDFVSSGCMRMAADDIVELFWAVRYHPSTPVTIQTEWIYDASGQRVDIGTDVVLWEEGEAIGFGSSVGPRPGDPSVITPDSFVGTPCDSDSECAFMAGGRDGWCYMYNIGSEGDPLIKGFCTVSCEGYCPDKAGHAPTFCTLSPENDGICVSRSSAENRWCDDIPGTETLLADRYRGSSGAPAAQQNVCYPLEAEEEAPPPPPPPADPFVGTPCSSDSDCAFSAGGRDGWCHIYDSGDGELMGFCTVSCEGYCPDKEGHATTFCVLSPDDGGICVSRSSSENQWCEDIPGTETTVADRYIGNSAAPAASQPVCLPSVESSIDFTVPTGITAGSTVLFHGVYTGDIVEVTMRISGSSPVRLDDVANGSFSFTVTFDEAGGYREITVTGYNDEGIETASATRFFYVSPN